MKTIYCKVKDPNHQALGGRYAVLRKQAWGKNYWSCIGKDGPWFPTAKQARQAAENDARGMDFTMPDGTIVTISQKDLASLSAP